MIFQAILQLGGVASVVPFLSVAAHPEGFASSNFGKFLVSIFHITDPRQLVYVTGTLSIFSLVIASAICNSEPGHRLEIRWVSWTLAADATPFQVLPSALCVFRFSQFCGPHKEGKCGRQRVHCVRSRADLCDLAAKLFTTVVILAGLLVLEPVATLAAAAFFGCFYLLFMCLTRRRVRTINEVAKETSQGLNRLVQQFIAGMRDIKLRDAGPFFISKIDAISGRQVTAGVMSAWIAGLPRNLIEPLAFAGTIIWAMAALSAGRLDSVLPTLGVMAMAGYRLLPNLQALYKNLHIVATNRYASG